MCISVRGSCTPWNIFKILDRLQNDLDFLDTANLVRSVQSSDEEVQFSSGVVYHGAATRRRLRVFSIIRLETPY